VCEVRSPDKRIRRYVYVEFERGADQDKITQAILADPLFLAEDTQVFPVENLAELEEGRGMVLDRRGPPGRFSHHHFLLEARFDESVLIAQVMLAGARALPGLDPGAYSLADVPISALLGELADKAEREWL
jgi:diaminopimelate dehydrogenase